MRPYTGGDRALEAVERALAGAAGADEAEAFLAVRSGEYTRFAGERIHQAQDIVERQLMVRVVVDGRTARAATSRIEEPETAARAALELARGGARGACGVARARPYPEPDLWHADVEEWDAAARSAEAAHVIGEARAAGAGAYGMFGRAVTELAVAGTGGVRAYAAATEASGALTVKAGEGSSYWCDLGRSARALGLREAASRTVAEAARARRPVELPDGVHDVVLGPIAAGELLHFFGAFGFTGQALAAGVGAVARTPGEPVAAPCVTVADDALAGVGLPFPFDIEGTPKRRVGFLTAGRVGEAVTDLATAAELGVPSTGHAHIAREESPLAIPANLVMAPGATPYEELVAGVERGVYVQRFWYTRVVDPGRTTITGVSRDGCFLIENGRITRPVAGKRFTESVFGLLSRVDAVGDTLATQPLMNVWNGAATAPALRVRGFRFGPRP
ncbi:MULTISPECIES: TldD/PmbA family protein [Streptosporangium]|uniref:TldD/PmbA family protein n=1 Tax=Streptosporangium jomthongense TaxID=1193683 RepID=A0ABV8ESK8_9ACTN